MDEPRRLGERIASIMRESGLTTANLARELDLGESSIRKILRGENVAQYIQLARLARALNSTPNILLGFRSDTEPATQGDTIDLDLVQAAFQGILEQLGLDRDAALVGAQLALETAREQTVVGEDPQTRVRILAKDRISNPRSEGRSADDLRGLDGFVIGVSKLDEHVVSGWSAYLLKI